MIYVLTRINVRVMIKVQKEANNMGMLKSKATIALILMVLGVAYIGGLDNSSLEDNTRTTEHPISVNA